MQNLSLNPVNRAVRMLGASLLALAALTPLSLIHI